MGAKRGGKRAGRIPPRGRSGLGTILWAGFSCSLHNHRLHSAAAWSLLAPVGTRSRNRAFRSCDPVSSHSRPAQSSLVSFRPSAALHSYPRNDGRHILRCGRSDGRGTPCAGPGSAAVEAGKVNRNVLDCSSAWTNAGVDVEAILGGGGALSLLVEFWEFLRVRKKFWLVPLLVLMSVFSGVLILAKGSAVAPFIYVIF
jgi:hypothetical protein